MNYEDIEMWRLSFWYGFIIWVGILALIGVVVLLGYGSDIEMFNAWGIVFLLPLFGIVSFQIGISTRPDVSPSSKKTEEAS